MDRARKPYIEGEPYEHVIYYVRIGVVGGGCSGLSYKLSLETEPTPTDKVLEFTDYGDGPSATLICGYTPTYVLIDLKSTLYLAGMELDYNDDLMNAGWSFKNPNVKPGNSCGCGESFST
jgi:iron-sulfur cluster assembly protein